MDGSRPLDKDAPIESAHPKIRTLLIAACFGLFCGLAEGTTDWILSVVPDKLGWKNDLLPEILWVAPIVDLLLFLAIGGAVVLVSRVFPKARRELLGYAVIGWLASYGVLSMSGRLHQITCVILALAFTIQLCRSARARRPVSDVFLVRIFAGLLLSIVIVALAGMTNQGKAESSEPGLVPALSDRPNVLLVTLDTLRADHLSSFGYSRPTTPNIDRLAREGVLFENAFATASWTLPSHASIMTGRYPYEHRAGGGPLNSQYPTLAEELHSRGYATAGLVANLDYCTAKTGLSRGFSTYEDNFGTVTDMVSETFYGRMLLDRLPLLGYYDHPGRKPAAEVNREFFLWLDANRGVRFFAFLNYFDVHDPYIAPSPYQTKFANQPNRGDLVNSLLFPRDFTGGKQLTEQQVQAEINGYDGSLAYLDNELGSLFDRLKVMGLQDNTLIIVTSDHGESFGNHGLYGHGNSLYADLIHVPLIIRYPRKVPAGLRVSEAVSLRAIPASVIDLLGLDSQSPFPGTPLSVHWSGKLSSTSERTSLAFAESLKGIVRNPAYPLGRRSIAKSISSSKWHLILYEEGKVELFQLDRDVTELNNLADTPEGKAAIKELGYGLEKLMPPDDWKIFCHLLNK